jgi:hypothetical protein
MLGGVQSIEQVACVDGHLTYGRHADMYYYWAILCVYNLKVSSYNNGPCALVGVGIRHTPAQYQRYKDRNGKARPSTLASDMKRNI